MSIRIHVSVALLREDRILLVQESKPDQYGQWNLPGGHVEVGETLGQAAVREALEETNLAVTLTGLVGVYTRIRPPENHAIRFVFAAEAFGEPSAGDDILAVRWGSLSEMAGLSDVVLAGSANLHAILTDIRSDRRFPLSLLDEVVLEA